MRMKLIGAAGAAVALGLVLTACGGSDKSNLKQIDQQRTGDYIVTALNETGQVKQGPNKFVLEFRKASDNKLTDVGNVQLNSAMPMPGRLTAPSGRWPEQPSRRCGSRRRGRWREWC